MHRRHRSLLTAALAAASLLASSPAGAQHFQQTTPTATSVVVNIGGTITWIAKEVKWPSGAPDVAAPRVVTRSTPAAQARVVSKWPSVELISPTSNADASLAQWAHTVGSATPTEVTLTLVTASGTPVAKYLLHRAVPTKLSTAQLDAGASQITTTHLTLTAQSIEVVPVGE